LSRVIEGSGFVYAPDHIITNAHVVAGSRRARRSTRRTVGVPGDRGLLRPSGRYRDPVCARLNMTPLDFAGQARSAPTLCRGYRWTMLHRRAGPVAASRTPRARTSTRRARSRARSTRSRRSCSRVTPVAADRAERDVYGLSSRPQSACPTPASCSPPPRCPRTRVRQRRHRPGVYRRLRLAALRPEKSAAQLQQQRFRLNPGQPSRVMRSARASASAATLSRARVRIGRRVGRTAAAPRRSRSPRQRRYRAGRG